MHLLVGGRRLMGIDLEGSTEIIVRRNSGLGIMEKSEWVERRKHMGKDKILTVIRLLMAVFVLLLGSSGGYAQKNAQTGPYRSADGSMQMRRTTTADRKKAAARTAARRAAAAQEDRRVLIPQGEGRR
jgi:hypothetical protein